MQPQPSSYTYGAFGTWDQDTCRLVRPLLISSILSNTYLSPVAEGDTLPGKPSLRILVLYELYDVYMIFRFLVIGIYDG